MKRNQVFDKVAKIYDEIRPSYPEELINDIIDKTKIKSNDMLLEIGAGTGKATVQLAEKGFKIHCIELGQNLADILKDKCSSYPNVTLDVSSFEEWQSKENKGFNLVYCAQAFHWIDPEIKYKKCHSLLKKDGHIALFWYQPDTEVSKVRDEINLIIRNYAPDILNDEVNKDSHVETMEMRRAEIISSGLFKNVQVFEYPWENKLDAENYIKSLNSYSKFACLDNEIKTKLNQELEKIINKHGGFISSKLIFSLFIAKKA